MRVLYDERVCADALPAPLRPWVRECYQMATAFSDERTVRVPVSATTDPALNVSFVNHPIIDVGIRFRLPPVTIAGPQPRAYGVEVLGTTEGYFVLFSTLGPLVLLGVEDYSIPPCGARPLHEMVRPEIADAAREWGEQLRGAASFARRVELTVEFFLAHRTEPDARVRLLQAALDAIEAAGGNVRIAELARSLGTGESTLRRHFRVLGMSPKHFASIVRFRRAHAFLQTRPDATWADVVTRFGYADQAHFVREYRRFSGAPPTRWESPLRVADRRMGIDTLPNGDD